MQVGLTKVEMNTFEIPVEVKYYFSLFRKNVKYYYISVGLTYQKENNKEFDIVNLTQPTQFSPINTAYLVPGLALGRNYVINERFSITSELSFRAGKCHCEFLNRYFDKIGLAILLMVDL